MNLNFNKTNLPFNIFISKKGFTIVEVSILFVIFLIVAFLVAPLSLDNSMQEKNASKWREVQNDFQNIFDSVNLQKNNRNFVFAEAFNLVMNGEIQADIEPYKITFLKGTLPSEEYIFTDFKQTNKNATLAYKIYEKPQTDALGIIMYDVNGIIGPNTWGKDVFGYNIYPDRLEPFCKQDPINVQKQDCSKSGTGLCCSNSYLNGGKLN